MPVTVKGPDGNDYQFPDGTDKVAAIAYFKKKGIGVKQSAQNPSSEAIQSFLGLPKDQQAAVFKAADVRTKGILTNAMHPIGLEAQPPKYSPAWIKGRAMTARDWLVNQLPNIGGIAGGIIGAGSGAESGPVALATSAAGAAAGGGLGEDVRQALTEQFHPEDKPLAPRKAIEKIGEEAGMQGLYDLAGHGVGKAFKAIPAGGEGLLAAKRAIGPIGETVEGVDIPQLATERNPKSAVAGVQRSLKKSGIGKRDFEDVAEDQQAAVKEAMRRSFGKAARRTIGADEPAEMASQAANAARARANPLYSRVWASRVEVPFDQVPMSRSSGLLRDAWNRVMRREGITMETQMLPNKSIGLMQQFRSELRAMAEASRDPSGRLDVNGSIFNDAWHEIDAKMRKSLATQNPGALKMWERANDLWAQSYAMDEVSRALAETTEGTPIASQVGGRAAAIPTEIQGASLVKRLNDLDRDGTLSRAFPDKGKAIRSLADMLDRAQAVRAADPNMWKFNYFMRYGAELALAGAAGLAAGKGKALNPSFAGAAVLAFLSARFGERTLIKLMTDKEAAPLLTKLATASSSQGVRKAAQVLYQMAPALLRAPSMAEGPAPWANPAEKELGSEPAQNPTDAWQGVTSQ